MQGNTLEDSNLQTFSKLYVLLYADDILLFGENETELQTALDATLEDCRKINVCILIGKTKHTFFLVIKSKKLDRSQLTASRSRELTCFVAWE